MSAVLESPPEFRIHRYPVALIERIELADGRSVLVRPVLPQDTELQRAFFRALSPASRYRRFHMALEELPASTLELLTQIDYASHLALLAEIFDGQGREIQVAEARYVVDAWRGEPDVAEFAVAVADGWQRAGLGRRLLQKLAARAGASGLRRLEGSVLADNQPMLALMRAMGWRLRADPEDARFVVASLEPGRTGARLHVPPDPRGMVRTRFAPSPTGFLHIGGARTALFTWAYARHFGGTFVLRIEDTDLERSTAEATQAILDGMQWLGLDPDEGPFYQSRRTARYREVIEKMLAEGTAYHCWCSVEELEAMRAEQEARGLKPRYDGRWRPEPGRTLPGPPAGVAPVVRFRNPLEGAVGWNDIVKGPIVVENAELDDLVIARSDGSPTYNFCVVVDDWDMRITHVIRGDDHVNNTPRQINILSALGAALPRYGHLPMIHGPDGQKLSKRHGAVSVMQYDDDGYLPEAVVNYLARLGWSHGDDEIFSREQLVDWFDGTHVSRSPARFDFDKLRWLNNHYLKQLPDEELARRLVPRLERGGARPGAAGVDLATVCGLLKERAQTLNELAQLARMFLVEPDAAALAPAEREKHLTARSREAVQSFTRRLEALPASDWQAPAIAAALKETLAEQGLRMPQLAVPVRLLVFGVAQTPSVDAMLAAMPRAAVLERLARWPA